MITPVVGSTVATDAVPDVKVPPEFPLEVKVVDPLLHIAFVPLKVPALGAAVMVKIFVDVALAQVPLPVAVNVSVTLPAVISAALGV